MKIDPEKQPALNRILTAQPVVPDGCSECPFARDGEDVNPSDPDEGHYQCALLSRRVWGEDPKCNFPDWQREARSEWALSDQP